jgi:hypothetical protein
MIAMEHMPNLAAYTEMMIEVHRNEVISLRRQLRPEMLFTADDRLDIKRRIAESERWVARWLGRLRRLRDQAST